MISWDRITYRIMIGLGKIGFHSYHLTLCFYNVINVSVTLNKDPHVLCLLHLQLITLTLLSGFATFHSTAENLSRKCMNPFTICAKYYTVFICLSWRCSGSWTGNSDPRNLYICSCLCAYLSSQCWRSLTLGDQHGNRQICQHFYYVQYKDLVVFRV